MFCNLATHLAVLLSLAICTVAQSTMSPKEVSDVPRGRVVPASLRSAFSPPGQPRCLSITQWNSNSVLASWLDNAGLANVTHYQIGYGLVPTERYVIVNASFNACIIDGLEAGKTYVVALRACNDAGCSPNREEDILLSREDLSSRKSNNEQQQCASVRTSDLLMVPMEVRCEPLSSSTVRVAWSDAGAALPVRLAGANVYYTVRHSPAPRHGLFELRPSANDESSPSLMGNRRGANEANSSALSLAYGNLRPAVSYEFAVRKVLVLNQLLVTGSGPGVHVQSVKQSSWSMKVECTTMEAAPANAPTELFATQVDVDVVQLRWQPCTVPNGHIINHTVLVCREPCTNSSWFVRTALADDQYNGGYAVGDVVDLLPNASYRFRVREHNSVGESPPSESTSSLFLDPNFSDDSSDDDDPLYDYNVAAKSPAEADQFPWQQPVAKATTSRPRKKTGGKRSSEPPRVASTSAARSVVSTLQEFWYAVVGAVTGAVTIGVVIALVIVCRRKRHAKMKRLLRERSLKQSSDMESSQCCAHSMHLQGTNSSHPHSTLSVSLHGTLPSDSLLYAAPKTPPATPHGALRRFGSPACVPLLNAANLSASAFTGDGESDYPSGTPTPYRLASPSVPAPRCGSSVGVGVELRSLSSTAESTGSNSNTDGQRSGRVPFVSPLHLPRTFGLLNAALNAPGERAGDLPALPPSQSLFAAHSHAHAMRGSAFTPADLETCTTAGTGSNSMASLSSSGFARRPLVDTTILSPLSKPRSLARAAAEQHARPGAGTPLSLCSSNSANTNSTAQVLSPGRTRDALGAASPRRSHAPMLLSPASGTTTIDPGYASSTSMSLTAGAGAGASGAPSVDSGCASSMSRTATTANHRREDFQSYKSFSTDELNAEIAHIEGIMKDLSSITQKDFDC